MCDGAASKLVITAYTLRNWYVLCSLHSNRTLYAFILEGCVCREDTLCGIWIFTHIFQENRRALHSSVCSSLVRFLYFLMSYMWFCFLIHLFILLLVLRRRFILVILLKLFHIVCNDLILAVFKRYFCFNSIYPA